MNVDEQADGNACELEVSKNLSIVSGQQFFNALQLYDYAILDDQVRAIPEFQPATLVNDGQAHLTAEREPTKLKLEAEAFFERRLQNHRPQLGMDLDRRSDDLVR